MQKSKQDILFSLLALWGLILFMILFSLAGTILSYDEYAASALTEKEEGFSDDADNSYMEAMINHSTDSPTISSDTAFKIYLSVSIALISGGLTVYLVYRSKAKVSVIFDSK